MSCAVLRCTNPTAHTYALPRGEDDGRLRTEVRLCDAHFEAIEAGEAFYCDDALPHPDDGFGRTAIYMGRDLDESGMRPIASIEHIVETRTSPAGSIVLKGTYQGGGTFRANLTGEAARALGNLVKRFPDAFGQA